MVANHEALVLRRAVEALGPVLQRRRFDADLRRRLSAHVRMRVASGAAMSSVARSLDLSGPTVARLLRAAPSLLPVRVTPAPERTERLVVRGPCGVSVEGTVDDIAALIVRLAACSA